MYMLDNVNCLHTSIHPKPYWIKLLHLYRQSSSPRNANGAQRSGVSVDFGLDGFNDQVCESFFVNSTPFRKLIKHSCD